MGIKGALTPPTRSFKYLKLNMCSIPYKFLQCFPPMAMQWHLSHPVMDVLLWTGAPCASTAVQITYVVAMYGKAGG